MLVQLPLFVFLILALSASPSHGLRMMKRPTLFRRHPLPTLDDVTAVDHISLYKRDKSPNPARKTYSGCRAKGSLCGGSHADSDIQMGECWSNSRVMGQKTAVFVPFEPGHKSYDSEGGPYGTCTAYPCYPREADLEASDNLADLCFFWDGTDSTTTGLNRRSSHEDGKKKKHKDSKKPKSHSKGKKHDKKEKFTSKTGASDDNTDSTSATGSDTMPSAPGTAIIPMPMICPHNLHGCYSASYFESGGKLAAFADAKPTYKGVWFPPKGSGGQPLFCHGLGLGCETPTMSELQTNKLSSVGCDVSKCVQRS